MVHVRRFLIERKSRLAWPLNKTAFDTLTTQYNTHASRVKKDKVTSPSWSWDNTYFERIPLKGHCEAFSQAVRHGKINDLTQELGLLYIWHTGTTLVVRGFRPSDVTAAIAKLKCLLTVSAAAVSEDVSSDASAAVSEDVSSDASEDASEDTFEVVSKRVQFPTGTVWADVMDD